MPLTITSCKLVLTSAHQLIAKVKENDGLIINIFTLNTENMKYSCNSSARYS